MRWRCLVLFVVSVPVVAGCPESLPVDMPDLPGLSRLSDEEQITQILNEVAAGMESRSIYKVLAHVSRGYADAEGRDYAALQAYLKTLFKNYREIRITRVRPQVYVQGNRARALESFGTEAKPVNPSTMSPLILHGQVTVYLEKTDNRWQIIEWGSIQ